MEEYRRGCANIRKACKGFGPIIEKGWSVLPTATGITLQIHYTESELTGVHSYNIAL